MILEAVGVATALSGSYVLRIGLQTTRTEARTVNVDGSVQGYINTGDIGGNANMSYGAAPPRAVASAETPAPVTKVGKPGQGRIIVGWFLIVIGLVIAGLGIYWNWVLAKP